MISKIVWTTYAYLMYPLICLDMDKGLVDYLKSVWNSIDEDHIRNERRGG